MADAFKTYKTRSGLSIAQTLGMEADASLKAFGRAAYREAQGIITASQPLVPVDTTALRSSSYVTEPEIEGDAVVVEMGYGGPAAQINQKTGESTDSYALYVHENLEAFHKVGSAKYLEMPFDQATRGMPARLAYAMAAEGSAEAPASGGFGEPEV